VVGIVVVSHSAALAEGVVELARQMGGEELALEPAGGLEDGSIGTDAQRVRAAIERAMSQDGVLVLMDLGSALMSAEMAVELLGADGRVELSEAPLVEGAVAAAAAARGGGSLEEVRAEAGQALEMKAAQLGSEPQIQTPAEAEASVEAERSPAEAEARIPVLNEIGLHARPAALVVELAGRFDADLRLSKQGGPGPVKARSLTGLMTLLARKGDELVATASGPQARDALAALEELARGGFGEGVGAAAPSPTSPPQRPPGAAPPGVAPRSPQTPPEPGARLHGIPASAGIALGPVRHLIAQFEPPPEHESQGPEIEWQRLETARSAARTAIERDRDEVARRGAAPEAGILSAHLALLDDDELLARARDGIDAGAAAEMAWHTASEKIAAQWRALEDQLLRERAADVEDTGRRVLVALAGNEPHAQLEQEGILVVSELLPGQAAALDPELARGVATAHGTATAHAAILARALGLPAVVGLGPAVLAIPEGTPVLLDGGEGELVVAPSEETEKAARRTIELAAERRRSQRRRAGEPAVMLDGTRVEVSANLGGAGDAAAAVALGADGVGLLRTEFLFLGREEIPSEDEQAETLAEIATALGGRPLIIRTLDVGADKPLPSLPMASERNPFLGRRGLRLSLEQPELFAAQLRAILRVAAEHPVKVMFPMVANAAELEAALAAVSEARAATGVEAPLEVGIMVEVPSAALLADQLAHHAAFFSIGTNDLTQYTMAAERGNELVAPLLAGPQPAVLQLVRATVAGAQAHGRWVGVCGELAGDPAAALLLVGLGVRELSMAAPLVPEVKEALRSVTLADAAAAARKALHACDAVDARAFASDLL
jgi:phosphoenolpyruvate-protein phosphotransferase/dihydroxyacetone kinase phosphotransfer subunit